MKVLMMVLMIGLVGCKEDAINEFIDDGEVKKVDDIVVDDGVVEPGECASYREIVDVSWTTYQILNNKCNTIREVVFKSDGSLYKVTKVVNTFFGEDEFVTIEYYGNNFNYRDHTIGRYSDNGTQAIDYDYVDGDNFITGTYRPSYFVGYIYEGEPEFDNIINDAHYDVVIAEVRALLLP